MAQTESSPIIPIETVYSDLKREKLHALNASEFINRYGRAHLSWRGKKFDAQIFNITRWGGTLAVEHLITCEGETALNGTGEDVLKGVFALECEIIKCEIIK